jgi:peptidoglycan/xylan/chitin deacetylase (PgdA/CDA1 family)
MAGNNSEITGQSLPTRLLKLIISLFVFIASECWAAASRLLGKKAPGQCIILYYHCVLPQHRLRFAKQMDMLRDNATAVPVGSSETLSVGQRYAAVTFDDGFLGVAQHAVPELAHRNIPATIFVTSDLLGQNPGWAGYPDRFMSLEELLQLPAELIALGSHTRRHPFLPRLTDDEARDEIAVSRAKLSEKLGRECDLFAFPYGAFDKRLIEICRQSGYRRIFTTLPYPAQLGPLEFVSGRVTVEPTDWPLEFFLKLHGSYRWLPLAFAVKRSLTKFRAKAGADGPVRSNQLRPTQKLG